MAGAVVVRALIVAAGVATAVALAWLATVQSPDDNVALHGIDARAPVDPASLAHDEDLLSLEQGRAYYVQLCMSCHGARGDGQGEWAYRVAPRPANLQRARVRGRSNAELDRIIGDGLPGTPMIGWKDRLTQAQRRQLLTYVRYLGKGAEPEKSHSQRR
jgi:mono/diheme cytochrome c family protein